MDSEQDKPEGTEQHPPGEDPARQGPGEGGAEDESAPTRPPQTGDPHPAESPARPGVTSPKR